MKRCTDVKSQNDRDHLYVMSPVGGRLHGLVKIGRSKNPTQRATELQDGQPYYMRIHALFWGYGHKEKKVHDALRQFQIRSAPGKEWFELPVFHACQAVSRTLFAGGPPVEIADVGDREDEEEEGDDDDDIQEMSWRQEMTGSSQSSTCTPRK